MLREGHTSPFWTDPSFVASRFHGFTGRSEPRALPIPRLYGEGSPGGAFSAPEVDPGGFLSPGAGAGAGSGIRTPPARRRPGTVDLGGKKRGIGVGRGQKGKETIEKRKETREKRKEARDRSGSGGPGGILGSGEGRSDWRG